MKITEDITHVVVADTELVAQAAVPSAGRLNQAVARRGYAGVTRGSVVLAAELMLICISFLLALGVLRDSGKSGQFPWMADFFFVMAIRLACLYLLGPFRSSLRHASVHELLGLVKAVSISSVAIFLGVNWLGLTGERLPLAMLVLDWALCLLLLGALHFAARVYNSQKVLWRPAEKRLAVVGAGDAGMSLVKELASDPNSHCRPVAIFDDNPRTHGTTICGVPVLGGTEMLMHGTQRKLVDEVLICVPSATRSEMSRLFTICCQSGLPVRTLPTLAEIVDGKVSQRDLRDLRIEDLLQREELVSDPAEIAEIVGDRVVLITGAGGSIGSELSRQIAACGPKQILLLERTENSLFYIDRELRERFPGMAIKPLLVDTTQRAQVDEAFRTNQPSLVFHAAAHKHVGLLELHPTEAIRNNVLGTRNVALAAAKYGVERFVNISTDKAVNPENYMGLSKKLTELCMQNLAGRQTATRFMNVRFGNVAGSTGSVLRLFWDHIRKGEPLHVTDPRATRFFMSIPEAVHLILRAAGEGRGGETFVLEMGEPINIYELAKSMSLLAGFAPGKELPIHFVGLRDGEKISEQLWSDWENPAPTSHKGIYMIEQQDPLAANILHTIDELEHELTTNNLKALQGRLNSLFPAFAVKRAELRATDEPSAENADSSGEEVRMKIPLSKPDIGVEEIRNVVEVLQSGRLSLGPKLGEFEEQFAAYVGRRYAIATNSGTSALHLCVRALGIGPQDEVITSAFSFVASTNCILYEGANPIFIDIDPISLNLDPKQLRRFLRQCCTLETRRGILLNKTTGKVVKAILPVHVFGLPCDMDPILELASQYGLRVLEDACEALGGEYHRRRVGTFGDAAVFAFYPNKQMTTGEGGMIVTDNQEIAMLCRSTRNQGRDEDSSWLRHIRVGFNYRLSELHCALGLAQLNRLPQLLQERKRVAEAYNRALSEIPHLILPVELPEAKRSWFVYPIQLDLTTPRTLRDRLILKLRARGIESQAYFPAIHKQPYLARTARAPLGPLYRTESASDRSLALPFFPGATYEEIEYVSVAVAQILEEELGSSPAGGRALIEASGGSR
jgi:FlaA1/EpsC-like NDP-sugar epimerase/dTDP-4-amino-4,6-dideoxygalactose transaminase